MRGYNREEVEQFLEHVAEALEDALNGRREAEDKVRRLERDIARFRELEESLKQAVVTAQSAMSQAREASSKEVESLKRAAQNEALSVVQRAETERQRVEHDIKYLKEIKRSHVEQFRAFLMVQLQTLEQLTSEARQSEPAPEKPEARPKAKPEVLPEEKDEDPGGPMLAEENPPVEKSPRPWQPERVNREEAEKVAPVISLPKDDMESREHEAAVAFPPPLRPGGSGSGGK